MCGFDSKFAQPGSSSKPKQNKQKLNIWQETVRGQLLVRRHPASWRLIICLLGLWFELLLPEVAAAQLSRAHRLKDRATPPVRDDVIMAHWLGLYLHACESSELAFCFCCFWLLPLFQNDLTWLWPIIRQLLAVVFHQISLGPGPSSVSDKGLEWTAKGTAWLRASPQGSPVLCSHSSSQLASRRKSTACNAAAAAQRSLTAALLSWLCIRIFAAWPTPGRGSTCSLDQIGIWNQPSRNRWGLKRQVNFHPDAWRRKHTSYRIIHVSYIVVSQSISVLKVLGSWALGLGSWVLSQVLSLKS